MKCICSHLVDKSFRRKKTSLSGTTCDYLSDKVSLNILLLHKNESSYHPNKLIRALIVQQKRPNAPQDTDTEKNEHKMSHLVQGRIQADAWKPGLQCDFFKYGISPGLSEKKL